MIKNRHSALRVKSSLNRAQKLLQEKRKTKTSLQTLDIPFESDEKPLLETQVLNTDKKKKPPKIFRIPALRAMLSYSQVPPEMTREAVINYNYLIKTINFKNYVISKERHQNGNFHFHALLRGWGESKYEITKSPSAKGKRGLAKRDQL